MSMDSLGERQYTRQGEENPTDVSRALKRVGGFRRDTVRTRVWHLTGVCGGLRAWSDRGTSNQTRGGSTLGGA